MIGPAAGRVARFPARNPGAQKADNTLNSRSAS
jgi:hypothetical protein